MGRKMKEQLQDTQSDLELKRGIVHQFLVLRQKITNTNTKTNKRDVNGDNAMDSMLETVIELISQRLPISDTMLLLCWKYENKEYSKNESFDPLKSRLWQSIEKVLNNILELPLNKKEYIWFRKYLFNSAIWYEDSISKAEKLKFLSQKQKTDQKNNNMNATNLLIFCPCGEEMHLAMPLLVYPCGTATCSICNNKLDGLDYIYHCKDGQNLATHANSKGKEGFDYCVSCAKAVAQKIQLETKQDANEDSINEYNYANQQVPVLFDQLLNITNSKQVKRVVFLQKSINKIIEESKNDWESMVDFKEYCICDPNIGIRQDFIIDISNGKQILKYPTKSAFNERELRIGKLKNKYNIGYLSMLMVTAHSLNKEFHLTMKEMLKEDSNVIYTEGPVKLMSRCVEKSETDYASSIFPSAAKIVDLVRGSLVYQNCGDLVNGLKNLIDKINKGDTCLKRVVRIKNKLSLYCLVFLRDTSFQPCLCHHQKLPVKTNKTAIFVT